MIIGIGIIIAIIVKTIRATIIYKEKHIHSYVYSLKHIRMSHLTKHKEHN